MKHKNRQKCIRAWQECDNLDRWLIVQQMADKHRIQCTWMQSEIKSQKNNSAEGKLKKKEYKIDDEKTQRVNQREADGDVY